MIPIQPVPGRTPSPAAAGASPGAEEGRPPLHPGWLLAAPHRLCFFAGALMLGASALWWAAALLSRSLGVEWHWALAPTLAHALVMAFGFMPLFFAGFLFTAGPKWLHVNGPSARELRLPISVMLTGWLAFAAGVHGLPFVAGLGLGAVGLGWSAMVLAFAGLVRASPVGDRVHAKVIGWACGAIAVLVWVAGAGVALESPLLVRSAVHASLWAGMAVVYAAVAHRMIPFFTASALPLLDAWRPMWLLWTLVAALVFELPFVVAEVWWWPLPSGVRVLQALVELPVGGLLLWLAWRWGVVQSMKVRLLAMLHLGFLWLGVAYELNAVSHLLAAATEGQVTLGLAPLHALTMGFLGSTLIAMATRVSCGHGGRTLAADDLVWRLFWVLQVAVVARVAAALWQAGAQWLVPVAALAWAGCMGVWAVRYGRWYLAPRADGRPG